jgi:lipopolysaccharide export system permease protein
MVKKIVASKGIYKDKLWTFYQCITYNFDRNGQIIGEPNFSEEEIMTISESPRDFLNQRQRPELMSISQIDEYIWRLSRSGASTVIRNLKIDLYQRYTVPFTSLAIIILGLPFSLIVKKRAAGLSSIGICILVGFMYYIMDAVSIALGRSGLLMPLVAASLSLLIALVTGLYLILRLP